ncbi:polyprenol phosphomannose-dependent alpha 1,6 mannosyltransferase MptB [Actinoplanes teichomyceticus]|uniref:polyprenol phosphomannose-dependent alpha 1,6 mannosyltransferase MptB n=1 Tax=Actinoplanes teichomyceticus TaxID=1867 RepID=UPI0011A32D40|nr:polyprenol phosphomannose-dependent alpha 1,6 mannosyltransferase MptB [Actinoplanes teichomyceticus]
MSSRTLRWTGFGGSVLLAVAGLLGGHGPAVVSGWVVGTALQAYAWWTGRDRPLAPRWVVGTIVLWAAPFLLLPPFGSRDVHSYACQGELWLRGLSPYEHTAQTLPCTWVDAVAPIWRDTLTPYGPLFVLAAAGVVAVAGALPPDPHVTGELAVPLLFRVLALAGTIATAAGLPVLARRCGVPPGRALWVALAGPLVGAHLLGGPHNDALMLGFLVGGLALAVRFPGRPVAVLGAGVLLGCAVAIKATAVVVIPFAALICAAARSGRLVPGVAARSGRLVSGVAARSGSLVAGVAARSGRLVSGVAARSAGPVAGAAGVPGRWAGLRGVVVAAAGVGGAAAATFAGITAAGGLGYGWITGLRESEILIQFSSLPTALGMTLTYLGRPFDPAFDAVPAVRAVALVVLAVVLTMLWFRALRERADPGRAALHSAALALGATVALAPVVLPWYALWPLVLLAATTVATRAVMAVTVAAAFSVLPDGAGLTRTVKLPGAILVTALLAGLAVVALRRRGARPGDPEPAAPIATSPAVSRSARGPLG